MRVIRIEDTVEEILARRDEARQNRDFETADFLRNGLEAAGIKLSDVADGVSWEKMSNFDPAKLETLK